LLPLGIKAQSFAGKIVDELSGMNYKGGIFIDCFKSSYYFADIYAVIGRPFFRTTGLLAEL